MIITAITAKKKLFHYTYKRGKILACNKTKRKKNAKVNSMFYGQRTSKAEKKSESIFLVGQKKNIDYNPCTCQSGTFLFYFLYSSTLVVIIIWFLLVTIFFLTEFKYLSPLYHSFDTQIFSKKCRPY